MPENVETKETLMEAATKEETEPLGSSLDTSEEIVADIPDPGTTKIFNDKNSSVEIAFKDFQLRLSDILEHFLTVSLRSASYK